MVVIAHSQRVFFDGPVKYGLSHVLLPRGAARSSVEIINYTTIEVGIDAICPPVPSYVLRLLIWARSVPATSVSARGKQRGQSSRRIHCRLFKLALKVARVALALCFKAE